jgi:hypothetical protein
MNKFWKRKPAGDGVTRTEGKTLNHNEAISTTTNAYICVQAFEGGIQEISVGGPTADVAFDLFKKVRVEVR